MKKLIAVTGMTMMLMGCGGANNTLQNPSGFLPNYSLLKQVPTQSANTQIYTYRNPSLNSANYHAMIVNPVSIYQTATKNNVKVDQISASQEPLTQALTNIVSKKVALTSRPGPGVATLNVAITGAELEGEGFKPRNIIPVSAVITLASKTTGLDNKKPVLIIELKIVDSTTGELLRETLTVISGDEFRNNSNTAQAFQQLTQKWIQQAYQYTAATVPAK